MNGDIAGMFEAREYRDASGGVLKYRLHVPGGLKPGQKIPFILQIHGMGSRGSDNSAQLKNGVPGIMAHAEMRFMQLIVLAPQCPDDSYWVETDFGKPSHSMAPNPSRPMKMLLELLEKSLSELPVDMSRIYVSGISMGGFASWEVLQRKGHLFAGALIVCGGGDVSFAPQLKDIPIWCTHGDADTAVLPTRSRAMRDAISAAGGNVILSEYPGFGHDVWTPTYSNPAYLDWLFTQRKRV